MNGQFSADHARFTEWVKLHGSAVRGYLWGVLRRRDVADDLTQDVFRRAWQARESYSDQGTARAYLLRIADRLAVDWFRRQSPWGSGDDGTREPVSASRSPADEAARTEEFARLDAALRQLGPTQRRVLLLRYYGQMSFADIAAAMNVPLGTALSHCRRGLLALKKLLAEELQ